MEERVLRQPAGDLEDGETGQGVPPGPGGEGGDPVCWLDRVCPECGRFADAAPPTRCTRCGARIGD